jgi:hypothetical protein
MLKPRKVSKAELKENDATYKGCSLLEPRLWLDSALIGKDATTGGALYDYETVIECFCLKDGLTYGQASEMVDYNTERAIPYMADPKPILVRESETEMEGFSDTPFWDDDDEE